MAHAVIPVLRKQRQEDHCEFQASLVYLLKSRSARLHSEILSQEEGKPESGRQGEIETQTHPPPPHTYAEREGGERHLNPTKATATLIRHTVKGTGHKS